jgi:hypothetical protein
MDYDGTNAYLGSNQGRNYVFYMEYLTNYHNREYNQIFERRARIGKSWNNEEKIISECPGVENGVVFHHGCTYNGRTYKDLGGTLGGANLEKITIFE